MGRKPLENCCLGLAVATKSRISRVKPNESLLSLLKLSSNTKGGVLWAVFQKCGRFAGGMNFFLSTYFKKINRGIENREFTFCWCPLSSPRVPSAATHEFRRRQFSARACRLA